MTAWAFLLHLKVVPISIENRFHANPVEPFGKIYKNLTFALFCPYPGLKRTQKYISFVQVTQSCEYILSVMHVVILLFLWFGIFAGNDGPMFLKKWLNLAISC